MANQQSVSNDVSFHAFNCYFMENMTAVFYNRVDKFCIFMQLLLGSAVMADFMNMKLIGLIIAIIAAYQFSCNPANIANSAKQQAVRYSEIIHDLPTSNDFEIQKKLKALEKKDSVILLSIRNGSYIQSSIATGNLNTANDKFKKLGIFKRFIIFIAGGIQR
ncbi:hypothetical protein I5E15_05465 [Providencia stuartii]|uniref:hypothetical protein n=1 Tax=Providencia stuartii TaxID=588 RepID=UPI0018C74177|nr:hypothetical protein [Providencia stuartii]MBG5896022.1 hypothetical protein [Providencia stuartii]